MNVKPLCASEKLLSPPYKGCGLSSDWFATMLASDNEQGQNRFARQMGQGGRRATLKRGWKAFEQQIPPDSNGWVDQGDIVLVHDAMFGNDIPDPMVGRIPLSEVWDAIGEYAVSAAIDTSAVGPNNAIRKYVGAVPHQVVWWKKKTVNGQRLVKHMCPMHNASNAYMGHWVNWDSAKRCARAINGSQGECFVALYPVGDWTRLKLEGNDATIKRLRARIVDLVEDKAALATTVLAQEVEIASLDDQLKECREDAPDAAVEALLDQLHEWELSQRPI